MQSDLPETEGQGTGCGPGYHHGDPTELYLTLLYSVLCVARTAVPPGHDDSRGQGRHQEAGDVLQPAAEGGLPPESDGEGNIDALIIHD